VFALCIFCCFLLARPLHLMSLLSFLGNAADALALLLEEYSDPENILHLLERMIWGYCIA